MQGVSDSALQVQLLDSLYLQKGSEGLAAICRARRYTAASYVEAINKYPKYWASIRDKTFEAGGYAEMIGGGIEKLKQFYPDLKPAKIYFTIGALRTGGTTLEDKVLIGAEIAFGDSTVVTSEFQEDYPHLITFFQNNNPDEGIVFTNVHEYVHTQQDTTIANSLLSRTLIEGVAEFIAEKAMDMPSTTPAVIYGKQNEESIKEAFVKEMFTEFEVMWFWGNANNQFGIGDLGYYLGYAICRSFYENAEDKPEALRTMIELDYLNEDEVFNFIDSSKYFSKPLSAYKDEFEERRPRVIGLSEFGNNAENVDPSIATMTLKFSQHMNTTIRNLRLGPLGEEHLLEVTGLVGWSDDAREITFEIDLKPNLRQQLLITDIFRSEEGYLLEPFLVDITTDE